MSYTIVVTTINLDKIKNFLKNLSRALQPEVLVFDHRCSPQVEKVCVEHGAKYIPIGDVAFAAAANTGIRMAKHDIILLSQDDVTPNGAFDKLFYNFALAPDAIHCANVKDSKATVENKPMGEGFEILDWRGDAWRGRVFVSLMLHRDTYNAVGGMDEKFYPCYWDDMDFLYRYCGLKNGKVYIWKDIELLHETKQSPARHLDALDRSKLYYEKKWGGQPLAERFTVPFNGEKQ